MSDGHERLRRLLLLVPYVAKHPGITVDELCTQLSMSRESLLQDLDLLTFVGRPPFQPDDYIDIYIENGRVYVDLDQRLSAPPRLTAAEGAALSAAATVLNPGANDALKSALAKLEKVIPAAAKARFRDLGTKLDAGGADGPSDLGPLTQAIAEHREVEFDYFNPGRNSTEARSTRPLELFSHHGHWYLLAWDNARSDERLFRLDRIGRVKVTDRRFAPTGSSKRTMPDLTGGEVRVRFSKAVAPYVKERFGDSARPLTDGAAEVKVSGESVRWLTQWVLSFGGEAEVLEPEWARQAIVRAAAASLES